MASDLETFPVRNGEDVVRARQIVRSRAMEVGFSLVEQTKIVTAASELARNTVIYGGGGEMHVERVYGGPKRNGLRLTFEDKGPGIADIGMAMQDGYSTSGGLGLGLPGTRRLMDDFEITSDYGKGTTITVRRWRR